MHLWRPTRGSARHLLSSRPACLFPHTFGNLLLSPLINSRDCFHMSGFLAYLASFIQSSASCSQAFLSTGSIAVRACRMHSSTSFRNLFKSLSLLGTRGMMRKSYFGDCGPGERIESLMRAAVSAWWAFRISSSRRMPAGRPSACLRRLAASAVSRYSSFCICLKRRR